jgi:ComF family protein
MAVIDGLKFRHVKDAATSLAELLDMVLPVLPPNTVLVPVPTLPSHIRSRGYDHTLLIVRALAKRRGVAYRQLLSRKYHDAQRGKSKKERFKQAQSAYTCNVSLESDVPYLLIDDVVTTNATLRYAADALRTAGAEHVWVGVLARQPLDKPEGH